jgi:hypothetical protein
MFRVAAPALFLALLAACTDGTNSGNIGSGQELSDIPDTLTKNVSAVSYDAGRETITLRLAGLDGGAIDLNYTRRTALDIGHYQAYTYQDDALDRHFTVLAAESNDGRISAGVTADGGQFNRYFGGGFYQRTGTFDAPPAASGQVEYAGDYAGITNLDTDSSAPGYDLLPVPAGTDPAIMPAQGARVSGRILIDVNFNEGLMNGAIFDRVFVDDTSVALPDLALLSTGIAEDGSFFGNIEFRGSLNNDIGDYGGMFAGANSSSVGGILFLSDVDNNVYGWTGDEEVGVFVLTQCGQTGEDATLCDLTR